MTIRIGIPNDVVGNERRVALTPSMVANFQRKGFTLALEAGAGLGANFADTAYQDIDIVSSKQQLYQQADIILKIQPPSSEEIQWLKPSMLMVGMLAPFSDPARIQQLCDKQVTSFALELLPRISRAQSMDVLSSQATVAGYKSVLLAANQTGRFFPMLTTAAGTIRPLKVLVIGVGVAGLQAIATARRLGAIVEAYDIRPEAREQVESLGAKFVDVNINASGSGGYARELTDVEKQQQQAILAEHVAVAEVVICTAAIPGRRSPQIINKAMVDAMKPGAVIVDIAAEGGGNCELTEPGKTIVYNQISIAGPLNLPSQLPVDASEMYARNALSFLSLLIKDEQVNLDWHDTILLNSALTHAGEVKSTMVRDWLAK